MQALEDLERGLVGNSIIVKRAKRLALPSPGHVPNGRAKASTLDGVGIQIANQGTTVVVVSIGTDEYVKDSAVKLFKGGGAGELAQLLPKWRMGRWHV